MYLLPLLMSMGGYLELLSISWPLEFSEVMKKLIYEIGVNADTYLNQRVEIDLSLEYFHC